VFFHTPKLELHIVFNVYCRNTLPEGKENPRYEKGQGFPQT
jgi:hypothetical protein